jgi:hypothetical protein
MNHIVTIGQFLDARIEPVIQALPKPARPRILDAYTEATGATAPSGLESIIARYLIDRDLDAVLYSDYPKWSQGPRTNRYGRTLVIRFPFHDPSMTPDRIALLLARMVMFFSLSTTGMTPRGRVGELPIGWNPAGYETVAAELTRASWEIGIDQVLAAEGFTGAIQSDIDERANQLLKQFGAPYSPPVSLSAPSFAEHFELARIAVALGEPERQDLLNHVAKTAPLIVARARQALSKLSVIKLEDPNTVREGLVALHDAAGLLLASVVVFDPTTGKSYGAGLTSN